MGIHVPGLALLHPILSKALSARAHQIFSKLSRLGDARQHMLSQIAHLVDTEFASIYEINSQSEDYYSSERLCVYFGTSDCLARVLSPFEEQGMSPYLEELSEVREAREHANSIVAPADRNNHRAMFQALFEEQKANLVQRIIAIRRKTSKNPRHLICAPFFKNSTY